MKKIITFLLVAVVALNFCHSYKKQSVAQSMNIFNRENLPSSVYSITSERDTIIKGKSGTIIRINKNTFVDSLGHTFHGHIKIELKEAISRKDIVLGNMTTLSNDDILESGGMIYINATTDNSNLEIAENSSIEVSIPAESKNENMKIFSGKSDPKTNQLNWVNPQDLLVKENSKDTILPPAPKRFMANKFSHDIIKSVTTENLIEPTKPQQYIGGRDTVISLIFDTLSFPELSQYRNVKFKLRDNSNFNPKDSKRIWMSLDLKKTEEEGLYIISFSCIEKNKVIEKSYKVSPVFQAGVDYQSALSEYNRKYDEFEKKKSDIEEKRNASEKEQKLAEKKRLEEWNRQLAEQQKQFSEQQRLINNSKLNKYATDPKTNYIFTMKKLGWSNIDCLYNNPKTTEVELITRIENQDVFDTIFVSMVFGNARVFLSGYQKGDLTYGFTHGDYEKERLPVGELVTIFSTAYKNGKTYFGIQKIKISEKQTVSLQLLETPKDKIKQEIMSGV